MELKNMLALKPFLLLLVTVSLVWGATGCTRGSGSIIMTVNGPLPADRMGITLVHEHVLVDFAGADSTGSHRWEKSGVVSRAAPFIREAEERGVTTFVDCTPAYVGRDPEMLRMLSAETGMQIITNTGYYGAQQNRFLPSRFQVLNPDELADVWIEEFRIGIDQTGIRPGFIKIGVDPGPRLSADHLKIITAAALAHKATGLVIASHTGPDDPAFQQMAVLDELGVDHSAFIWVHAQGGSLGGNIRAARSGCWISLDGVNAEPSLKIDGISNTVWYADRILRLREAGVLQRVLISHDAGWYSPGEVNGGAFRGYTGIFTTLLPLLRDGGLSSDEIDQLLRRNPMEAFAIRKL